MAHVIMGTRTNYEFGRHNSHRNMTWITLLMILSIVTTIAYKAENEDRRYYWAALPVSAGLLCRNGRRLIGRGFKEGFSGVLYSFTGVAHLHNTSYPTKIRS